MRIPMAIVLTAAALISAAITGSAWGQVESGLAGETRVPELKVLWLNNSDRYEEKDVAKERGERPTVYVFVQASEWSRPMARFVRGVDEAADNVDDAAVVAVWVGDDVDTSKEYLPRGRGALRLRVAEFAVHPGDKSGPAGWGINDRAFLTAVVARGGKVVESFAFISVNETDVPKVAKALKKAAED